MPTLGRIVLRAEIHRWLGKVTRGSERLYSFCSLNSMETKGFMRLDGSHMQRLFLCWFFGSVLIANLSAMWSRTEQGGGRSKTKTKEHFSQFSFLIYPLKKNRRTCSSLARSQTKERHLKVIRPGWLWHSIFYFVILVFHCHRSFFNCTH